MTLKNAVNELFDCAKAYECPLDVAYARKSLEIKSDPEHFMTQAELDEAYEFSKTNNFYNVVVEARETGNEEFYDEALAAWSKRKLEEAVNED